MRRRLILTKDIVAFAQVDDDIMIDFIPLAEVEAARIMETEEEGWETIKSQASDSRAPARVSQDFCSLLIKTIPDGQNGGRDYYLRTDAAETCKGIVRTLKRAARSAKFRAKANTRFAKSQFAVRKIYVSGPFHYTSAFLIAAVSPPPPGTRFRTPSALEPTSLAPPTSLPSRPPAALRAQCHP